MSNEKFNKDQVEPIEIVDVLGERPLNSAELTGIEVEELTPEHIEEIVSIFSKIHGHYGQLTPEQHATVNQEIAKLEEYASLFKKGGIAVPEFITEGIKNLNITLEPLRKAA